MTETCMECGEPLGMLATGNLCIGCAEMKMEEIEARKNCQCDCEEYPGQHAGSCY